MMLRELYFSMRKNMVFSILITIFSLSSLLLMFVMFRFSIQTTNTLTRMNESLDSVQIFHLSEDIDQSPGGVPMFLQPDGLERQKEFYYGTLLAMDNNFSVTSTTDSMFLEIDVNDFRGGEAFQRHYIDGFNVGAVPFAGRFFYQIQAITIDYFGWNIFPLDIEVGRGLESYDFSVFTGGPIPIVLGHEYLGYYEIGDIITGYYAAEEFDFEVVGILAKNQKIFFWQTDYRVDYYILIPFVSFGEPESFAERDFQGFYYMLKALNTYIFVDDNVDEINQMRNVIHTATAELGIGYFFSLMDRTFIRHIELDNLIHHNSEIINMLLISSAVLIGLITLIFARIKYARREMVFRTQKLLGTPKYKLIGFTIFSNATSYIILTLLVAYYAVYYSDIIVAREQLDYLSQLNLWWHLRFFTMYLIYDFHDYHHVAIHWTMLYSVVLFVVSTSYPIYKINQLYGNKKSMKVLQ